MLLKIVSLIILLSSGISVALAQHNLVIKGTIYSKDHSKIKGKFTNVNDSGLLVSAQNDTALKYISAKDIRSVKVKRNGFVTGAAFGTVIGGVMGYAFGYITYNSIEYDYTDDSDDKRARALIDAIIGAVPGAVVGGITGGIFTKRHFVINGDVKKLQRMFQVLLRAEK